MYTWGCVRLGVCKPWQWLGAEYFLYLTSDKNSLSEKFQKAVFRTPKLKLFAWQVLQILFNITQAKTRIKRLLQCLILSKVSNYNGGWPLVCLEPGTKKQLRRVSAACLPLFLQGHVASHSLFLSFLTSVSCIYSWGPQSQRLIVLNSNDL